MNWKELNVFCTSVHQIPVRHTDIRNNAFEFRGAAHVRQNLQQISWIKTQRNRSQNSGVRLPERQLRREPGPVAEMRPLISKSVWTV